MCKYARAYTIVVNRTDTQKSGIRRVGKKKSPTSIAIKLLFKLLNTYYITIENRKRKY